MEGRIVDGICIDYDPLGSHKEDCAWWEGGVCRCRAEMVRSLAVAHHCHECDFVNSYDGATPCNCNGRCICDREGGCPCVADGLEPHP